MKKILCFFIFFLIICFFSWKYLTVVQVLAEQCESDCSDLDDCTKKITECRKAWEMMEQAKKPHEESLRKMESDLENFQNRLLQIEQDLSEKELRILEEEKNRRSQKELLSKRIFTYYIKSYYNSPLLTLFSENTASLVFKQLSYYQNTADQNKNSIIKIINNLKDLHTKKKNLEKERIALDFLKKESDQKVEVVRKLLADASNYQKKVEGTISSLTARQQDILSAKTSLFSTSVGDVPLADDPASRPDYNPGFSPAFAAFSFGAPHFRGMSQYGAYGRAKDGQNEEQILKAYYGDIRIEQKNDLPSQIETTVGVLDFENNYLLGIAEMPSSWDANNLAALKAQAIAARSYAYVHGKPICVDEGCQVYLSSKAASPPDNWRRAVEETRGKVIVSNQSGQVVNSWYSSTSGGYQDSYAANGHTTPSFWDTKNGRSGWTSSAYEKIAESPWFYKAWYKTRSGISCGRSHPYLTSEEFADIANAAVILQNGGDVSGIFPIDVQSCFGGSDQPWSFGRLKEEADRKGGAFSAVSSVSVVYSDNGFTAKIIINGREIDGPTFKKAFNLRAPGALNIKSGLYNIEKK